MRVHLLQKSRSYVLIHFYFLQKLKIHLIIFLGSIFLFSGVSSKVYGQVVKKVEGDSLTNFNRPTLFSPADSNNQLNTDRADKNPTIKKDFIDKPVEAKQAFSKKTGFKISADYISIFLRSTESLGEKSASSGVFRVFGRWDLLGRNKENSGGLVYKIENRHGYGTIPPSNLSSEIGSSQSLYRAFNDLGFRTTNLYWRQSFNNERVVSYLGFLDTSDWTDAFSLASPWEGFNDLAFSFGSSSIGLQPSATFGLMVSAWLNEKVYAIASITDANANPLVVFDGFDTFFSAFETFKTIEIGIIKSKETARINNFHITYWQVDQNNKTGEGWGLNGSASVLLADKYEPFLRGGWSKGAVSTYETSISAGLGYYIGSHVLGLGINWGRPNKETFKAKLDDQISSEVFFRWQVAHQVQLSPSVQFVINPGLNPRSDMIAIFGLRSRIFI